jgi:hypothetical protein
MAGIQLPLHGRGSGRPARGIELPTAADVRSQMPARAQADPGLRVPGPVKSGLEDFGQGIVKLGEGVFLAAERQQKEYNATKTGEVELAADDERGKEYLRRQTEDDASRPDFMGDFENWLKQDTAKRIAALPPGVSPEAREKLRLRLMTNAVAMGKDAGKLSLAASGQRAKDVIGKQVNQWSAWAERDPDFAGIILDQADERLAGFKGTMDANAERDQRTAARSSIIKGSLVGLARQGRFGDAETILNSGKYDEDLTAADRASVHAVIESGRKERLRVAEKSERDAEKRLGVEADQALKNFYTVTAGGGVPTVADVETLLVHPGIKPAEYKGALETIKKLGGDEKDDRDFVGNVMPRLHTEDLTRELGDGLARGHLKTETYRTLMMQNKTNLADDRPASPYKSGRDFVSSGLDPGQLGPDPFVRAALKSAQSDALVDYDTWARGNEKMTPDQAITKAREIRTLYQNVAFDQMTLALPRPRGYSGAKPDVTVEHIGVAQREIRRMIQAGAISETEAAREIEQLNTWETVIARQAAAAKPVPKK